MVLVTNIEVQHVRVEVVEADRIDTRGDRGDQRVLVGVKTGQEVDDDVLIIELLTDTSPTYL